MSVALESQLTDSSFLILKGGFLYLFPYFYDRRKLNSNSPGYIGTTKIKEIINSNTHDNGSYVSLYTSTENCWRIASLSAEADNLYAAALYIDRTPVALNNNEASIRIPFPLKRGQTLQKCNGRVTVHVYNMI